MPRRDYTDSAEISLDIQNEVTSNVIITPEGAHTRGISPHILQFYETARAASRGWAAANNHQLDHELRVARHDPHFATVSAAITRAAEKAENEERFR